MLICNRLQISGDFKLLSIISDERHSSFSDIPTFKENGIDLEISFGWGISAPKGIPTEIKKNLSESISEAVEDDSWTTFIKNIVSQNYYLDTDEYQKYLEEKLLLW